MMLSLENIHSNIMSIKCLKVQYIFSRRNGKLEIRIIINIQAHLATKLS